MRGGKEGRGRGGTIVLASAPEQGGVKEGGKEDSSDLEFASTLKGMSDECDAPKLLKIRSEPAQRKERKKKEGGKRRESQQGLFFILLQKKDNLH